MKKNIFFLLISMLISFALYSCKEDENTTSPPVPVCDQACQDEHTAYGYIQVFWYIWNQNIAGQPVGTKDFTVPGPQGGSVHVTGTTDYASNGVNTLHLVLQMIGCKGMGEKYNLTFNGTITADGTFSLIHKAITYASPVFGYTGTVGKDDWVTDVDGNCGVIINEAFTSVSGTICSREFAY